MKWNNLTLPDGDYFHDEDVLIYHSDCRDILQHILQEVIITDPPYGIDYQSHAVIERLRKPKIVGDDEFPMWMFDYCRPSMAMFVWCRWDNLYILPKPKSFIVWDKGGNSQGDLEHEFGRQWEGCAFYPGPDHKFDYRPSDVVRVPKVPPGSLLHPNEKPVSLMMHLIKIHSRGIVIDPFMGSGTTLRAAKNLGRKSIGIDIDEKWCKMAAGRMAQTVMDLVV